MTYQDFSTYGPKAMAGIGRHLPDTVADRSIPIEIKRKEKKEIVERFKARRVRLDSKPLKEKLAQWAAHTNCWESEMPIVDELNDRAEDIWEILFQIALEAGNGWPKRARAAALDLSADDFEDDSLAVRLLADIRTVWGEQKLDCLSSKTLVVALTEIEEAPWGEMAGGRPLSAIKLSRLLKPHGVKPTSHRMGVASKPVKGYLQSDFRDAWARYLPAIGNTGNKSSEPHNEGVNAESATGNKTPTVTGQLPIEDTTSAASSSDARDYVTAVTGRDGDSSAKGWAVDL